MSNITCPEFPDSWTYDNVSGSEQSSVIWDESYQIASGVITILHLLIVTVTMVGFTATTCAGREKVRGGEKVEKPVRSILIVAMLFVGTVLLALSVSGREFIGRDKFACDLFYIMFRTGQLLSTLPLISMLLMYSSKLYLLRMLISSASLSAKRRHTRALAAQSADKSMLQRELSDNNHTSRGSRRDLCMELLKYFFTCGSTFVYENPNESFTSWETYRSTRLSSAETTDIPFVRTSHTTSISRAFSIDESTEEAHKAPNNNSLLRSRGSTELTPMASSFPPVQLRGAVTDEKLREKYQRRAKFFTRWPLAVGTVTVVLGLLVTGTIFELLEAGVLGTPCTGCEPNSFELVLESCFAIFIGSWLLLATYGLRSEPDPFSIVADIKFAALGIVSLMAIGPILSVADPISLNAKGKFTWMYISQFGSLFVFLVIGPSRAATTWIINRAKFTRSTSGRKLFQTSPSTVPEVSIEACLQSPSGVRFFERHLIHELSVEALYFWLEARSWQRQFRNYNTATQARALDIYNTFIRPGGLLQINLSHRARRKIADEFEQEQFVDRDVFDSAVNTIFNLLRSDSYLRFIQSEYYQEWRGVGSPSKSLPDASPRYKTSINGDELGNSLTRKSPRGDRGMRSKQHKKSVSGDFHLDVAEGDRGEVVYDMQRSANGRVNPKLRASGDGARKVWKGAA